MIGEKDFRKLIERIAAHDNAALEEFYGIFGKIMKIAAYHHCGSKELTEEIIDDVMIRFWNKTPTFSQGRINPAAWVYTVTKNAACDRIRLENRKACAEIKTTVYNDPEFEKVESEDAFYRMIEPLKQNERTILIYRVIEHLQFDEIAEKMQISASTVTSVYYRSLVKLAKIAAKNKIDEQKHFFSPLNVYN